MRTLVTAVTLATLMVSSAFAQPGNRYSAGAYDRAVNGSLASTPGQR